MKNREKTQTRILKRAQNNFFSSFIQNKKLPALSKQILNKMNNPERFIETEAIEINLNSESRDEPKQNLITKLRNLKNKLVYKWKKSLIGFRVHSTVFIAVNAFLIFLNIITPGSHPWAFYPLTGWAIGLLSHYQLVRNLQREKDELLPLKGISNHDLSKIRKIQKSTSTFRSHLMAFLSVIGFLFGVNLITSGLSPAWFLYPAASWFVGLAIHFSVVSSKKKLELETLDQVFLEEPDREASPQSTKTSQNKILIKAINLKDKLYQQWTDNKEIRKQWGEEAPELLDQYINQISESSERHEELADLLKETNLEEQKIQLKELEEKQKNAESPLLKKEYEKSIQHVKTHIKSIKNVSEHQEIINLQINSALSLLQQMQLNIARLQGLDKMPEINSLNEIRNKTKELSQYIDDLEDSYSELDY